MENPDNVPEKFQSSKENMDNVKENMDHSIENLKNLKENMNVVIENMDFQPAGLIMHINSKIITTNIFYT